MKKRFLFFYLFVFCFSNFLFSQNSTDILSNLTGAKSIELEFINQKNTDILRSLAVYCDKTLNYDETISGSSTFYFFDTDFESALERFCKNSNFFWKCEDGIYFVSKILIEKNSDSLFSVKAEDANANVLLKKLSRQSGVSILFDPFVQKTISFQIENASISEILDIVLLNFEGYEKVFENKTWILKNQYQLPNKKTDSRFSIKKNDELYSVEIIKANVNSVFSEFFRKSQKQSVLLCKQNATLENLKIQNKTFDEVLAILLQISLCDFVKKDDVFFIFDTQKKDSSGIFKNIHFVTLKNTLATDVLQLFPQSLNVNQFVKIDKEKNSFIIFGSETETEPILDFLKKIDGENLDESYQKFCLKNISVENAISVLPKKFLFHEPVKIENQNFFLLLTTNENGKKINDFLNLIDQKNEFHFAQLKYLKYEEFAKFLTANFYKDCVFPTCSENSLLFLGSEKNFCEFSNFLQKVDKPKTQICYQILVIQHQKSKGKNLGFDASLKNTSDNEGFLISSSIANLFNIDFDILANLGLECAINLNAELSENKAKILADTTLNGLDGKTVTFENKNIFRYRDIITDSSSLATYSSVVKEISTGLVLKLTGSAFSSDLVNIEIEADLSKQGTSNSDSALPSTSEKKVSSCVQIESGKTMQLASLLQSENDENYERLPFFKKLFSSKNENSSLTEFVIYLTPFIQKDFEENSCEQNIQRFYEKYIERI